MIKRLETKIISFMVFTSVLLTGMPARPDNHQHSKINKFSNGTIEAEQLTICTVESGKNLKDVENRAFHYESSQGNQFKFFLWNK